MKAVFIGFMFRDNKGHRVLRYEYKGKRYDVIDHGWDGGEPLSWQHKLNQARIEQEIIDEAKPKSGKYIKPASLEDIE